MDIITGLQLAGTALLIGGLFTGTAWTISTVIGYLISYYTGGSDE